VFIDDSERPQARVTSGRALRHLLVFQFKLGADAARDFILSPLSIIAFAVDAIRKPTLEDSLYLRLMALGRRSDRVINLFDEHRDAGEMTIDRAVDQFEDLLRKENRESDAGSPPDR